MSKYINGYKVVDGVFEAGSAVQPSFRWLNDLDTGLYSAAANTIGFTANGVSLGTWTTGLLSLNAGDLSWSVGVAVTAGRYSISRDLDATNQLHFNVPTGAGFEWSINDVARKSLDTNGNLILAGGTGSGQSNIQFQSTASNLYDTNLLHVSSTAMTMGMIAGSTPVFAATNGPYIGLRGNTYSAVVTKRGNLFLAAGSPSTPLTGEGEIQLVTGAADTQRFIVDKGGVVYIPTPSTNRFVAGGTASLAGQMATIIGNTAGVGVLAVQNTTAANAGYAQIDLYNSSGTQTGGFGYGNSATVAATQDRTYFFSIAKAFHISTDSNVTRQFILAATSGALSLTTKATAGGVAGFTYTPGAHTAVTANITDFSVAAHTMTITGGYASQIFSQFAAPIISAASGLTVANATNVIIEMSSVAGSAIITNNTALFLGSPAAAVTVANTAGTHLSLFETGNQSFTFTAATQVTNAIGVAGATIGIMTVNRSGGDVIVDNVASFYIAGPLTAGAGVTLTNNDALRVATGRTRLGGDLLSSGAIIFDSTTTSSGAGAVAITGSIHEVTTTGTGDALTLADGTEGQRIVIVYVAEGAGTDTAILTPSNMGGGTTVTFSAVGQRADGVFTNGKWYFIAQGAVIA